MRTVKIDGDLFGLTIPEEADLTQMAIEADCGNTPIDMTYFLNSSYSFLSDEHTIWLGLPENRGICMHINFDGKVDGNGSLKFSFRPVLIPLTSDGIPDIRSADENPDYEFSSGGSVYIDGQSIQMPWEPRSLALLEIGDTSDFPMTWMWYNGKLYWAGEPVTAAVQDVVDWIQLVH